MSGNAAAADAAHDDALEKLIASVDPTLLAKLLAAAKIDKDETALANVKHIIEELEKKEENESTRRQKIHALLANPELQKITAERPDISKYLKSVDEKYLTEEAKLNRVDYGRYVEGGRSKRKSKKTRKTRKSKKSKKSRKSRRV